MGEWEETALSELADLSGGFAFKSGDYAPSGRFILRTLNIDDDGSINHQDPVFLPAELCTQYERFELQPEDTLFVMVGATLGKVGFVRKRDLPALLNQNMWLVRARRGRSDPLFLHYAFRLAVRDSLGWASGSARDFVRRDDYRNLAIKAPSLDEQQQIGRILGDLDDKIELNRRMNETLEAMARALFKSWFVDFDPVRAKSEGRDPGLPAEITTHFSDSLADSGMGDIPVGWRLDTLSTIFEINPLRSLSKGTDAPYIDMASIPTSGHVPSSWPGRSFGSGMKFINGDTLVARITPCLENGKTAFIDILEDDQVGWGSTEYIVLRPKPPLPLELAYCLARSDEFREVAIRSMTGSSGRQRVPVDAISSYRLAVPPKPILEAFGRIVSSLFARSTRASADSRRLSEIREALLPKLISGEIRVERSHE